jgi:hypothetical protein
MSSNRFAVGIFSLLAPVLVLTGACQGADATDEPSLLFVDWRPWRLQVTALEGLPDGGLAVGGWLIHATAFGDSGYPIEQRYHRVHTSLDIGHMTATVTLHERYEGRDEAEASGWGPAFGEEAAAHLDLDLRIATHDPETPYDGDPDPDRYGTGILRLDPKDESRAFAVLHYDYYSASLAPPYEPVVIVDCSGECCLAYRFSLTAQRRRTDCSHAFEGAESEVGTELLGSFVYVNPYANIFEHGLANLETEELAEMCRAHERLPMDQMGDYDVCDYWSLLNDLGAFCPCTRVECTCTDPDQDCRVCGP